MNPVTHSVTVRHNFETAHRLPDLGGKCVSLHGHSWWVDVEVGAHLLDEAGTVLEFGALKAQLRTWIDTNLDHGSMLGVADPLCEVLAAAGCKVFPFGEPGDPSRGRHELTRDLQWPTVENVAVLLGRVARQAVASITHGLVFVQRVHVRETHVNQATWTAP